MKNGLDFVRKEEEKCHSFFKEKTPRTPFLSPRAPPFIRLLSTSKRTQQMSYQENKKKKEKTIHVPVKVTKQKKVHKETKMLCKESSCLFLEADWGNYFLDHDNYSLLPHA